MGSHGRKLNAAAVSTGLVAAFCHQSFFGSAVNNFGVQLLLDSFLDFAPGPQPRRVGGRSIDPARDGFSGFIFKIQANMDPKHRDRLAFVRVCSGRFERDMTAVHTRNGKRVKDIWFTAFTAHGFVGIGGHFKGTADQFFISGLQFGFQHT